MFERIDPNLARGADALPVTGNGRQPPRKALAPVPRAGIGADPDDPVETAGRADDMRARLAAVASDVERLARDRRDPSLERTPPSAAEIAALLAGDQALALAAQAALGPAGVRLVLDAEASGPAPGGAA